MQKMPRCRGSKFHLGNIADGNLAGIMLYYFKLTHFVDHDGGACMKFRLCLQLLQCLLGFVIQIPYFLLPIPTAVSAELGVFFWSVLVEKGCCNSLSDRDKIHHQDASLEIFRAIQSTLVTFHAPDNPLTSPICPKAASGPTSVKEPGGGDVRTKEVKDSE
jgi:hypothetical protein